MIEALKALAKGPILKLPEGNPALPHGDPSLVETWNPGRGYLNYRLLGYWLSGIVGLGVALGMIAIGLILVTAPESLADHSSDVSYALASGKTIPLTLVGVGLLLGGLFSLGSFASQYVILHLELDMLRYTLTDEALRLRRGVVNVEEVTLSFANIQNVKFNQGPVQRYFGIGDLIVEVAGGGAAVAAAAQQGAQVMHHQGLIKGISDPEKLRDTIQARVRRFRGSGLGGAVEIADEAEPAAPTDLESPEALALLSEIRAALAATHLAGGGSQEP